MLHHICYDYWKIKLKEKDKDRYHGIIADMDPCTKKITKVGKYYNNDRDSGKPNVYFEEHEIKGICEIKRFHEATPEEVFNCREFYHGLDSSGPYLNMTESQISKSMNN